MLSVASKGTMINEAKIPPWMSSEVRKVAADRPALVSAPAMVTHSPHVLEPIPKMQQRAAVEARRAPRRAGDMSRGFPPHMS